MVGSIESERERERKDDRQTPDRSENQSVASAKRGISERREIRRD